MMHEGGEDVQQCTSIFAITASQQSDVQSLSSAGALQKLLVSYSQQCLKPLSEPCPEVC